MKLDQIAFKVEPERFVILENVFRRKWADGLATKDVVRDTVTVEGTFLGEPIQSEAELMFTYEFGIEYEHLYFLPGDKSFHDLLPHPQYYMIPGLSHVGFHVDELPFGRYPHAIDRYDRSDKRIVMDVKTICHSNPGVGDRRYHYLIVDERREYGTFFKFIKRL